MTTWVSLRLDRVTPDLSFVNKPSWTSVLLGLGQTTHTQTHTHMHAQTKPNAFAKIKYELGHRRPSMQTRIKHAHKRTHTGVAVNICISVSVWACVWCRGADSAECYIWDSSPGLLDSSGGLAQDIFKKIHFLMHAHILRQKIDHRTTVHPFSKRL